MAKTKRFKLAGTVIDTPAIMRLRPQWESLLADEMERKGFVRNYDNDPVFKTNKSEVGYEWELYIQGVFVGKQASRLSGIANGVSIPKAKSKQQSQPVA